MLTKKRIIILAAALTGSFLITFLITWLFAPVPQAGGTEQVESAESVNPAAQTNTELLQIKTELLTAQLPDEQIRLQMKESQLDELITELRIQLQKLQKREDMLIEHEKRIQMAEQILAERAKGLTELSAQLVGPMEDLKNTLDELKKNRIIIAQNEVTNLKRVAAVYDKMGTDSSSEILAEMCSGNKVDEVVKILRYMSERIVANLLAEMPDRSLAAELTAKMKTIQTES